MRKYLKPLRKLIVGIVGGVVLAIGIAMLVLPGPAVVVIPIGLAILATEFPWAQRIYDGASRWLRNKGSSLLKMWRSRKMLLSIIAAVILLAGCSKSSRIEGQVVNGKGEPLAGVHITAVQAQRDAKKDPPQTTADSQGHFRIKGLLPESPYFIVPSSDKWKTSARKKVRSGSAGESPTPREKIIIRFTYSADGVIHDTALGLEWAPVPKETMNWIDAQSYSSKPQFSRSGWRLPTLSELRSLYDESFEGHVDPGFRIDRNWVWALDSQSESDAWFFSFENGYEDSHPKEWLLTRGRVLIVRPAETKM
jgi:uncharacterized protein (TIGR02611 family)